MIGLYGTWGIGKTSLMNLIREELTRSGTNTVWFDAWMHQFDESPSLALLHTVVNTFDMKEEGKKRLAVIASAFGSLLLKATTTLELKDVDELGKRYEEERFQARDARMRLREYFQELIAKARGPEKHRLVFLIDDLDRCLPPQTLALLEALKLYLNLEGCVYFLGVDREALECSVRYHYKETEISETSYLDKIVQLPFTIPPVAPESMDDFVGSLLPEGLDTCKELLVKGLGENPRQVKRFISTLTLNHVLASELGIPRYDARILAVVLLVQTLAPDLYRVLPRQPDILEKLKSEEEESKGLREKYLGPNERLREILAAVEFPPDTPWQRYIYLTEVARVTEEAKPARKEPPKEIDLAPVLAAHAEWVKSEGKKGQRANLSEADLFGANLNMAILGGANLRESSLRVANLRGANLHGVNLFGADLSMGMLEAANLREANLSGANLFGADLNRVDLQMAILELADLGGANLSGTDLRGANLRGVKLLRAVLSGANLYEATGLTEEQLASAITDETTTLPDGSKGPFQPGSGAHQPLTKA